MNNSDRIIARMDSLGSELHKMVESLRSIEYMLEDLVERKRVGEIEKAPKAKKGGTK